MTVGKRRAVLNTAIAFRDRTRSEIDRAFIMQRSTTAAEAIAALVEPDLDVAEIVRVARRALAGDRRATVRFLEFDGDRINSLARVLCLSGREWTLDSGLDILRATAMLLPRTKMPLFQRLLLADALILRRRYDEASAWLPKAGFSGVQLSRYSLSVFNPFRPKNGVALPVSEWLELFNEFMSPSGDLAPIELANDSSVPPFERITTSCARQVDGPLVTVVMSSYRPDDSIFGSIRSILNQTWRSLELLVVDDASGPEYDEIYRRVARMDTRIRLVRQKVNGGTYLIRNRAISLARGKFIGFQDDDDWSHPERIERQMAVMLSNPAVMATQSHCFRTDEDLDPVKLGYRHHLRRNESSLLFRAEVVRRIGFFHFTRKGGDTEYRLRLEAAYGRPTTVVGKEALAIIRLTPGSLSRDEFSPGFRHPSRFVYTESFKFAHDRAQLEDSYFRPNREYVDSFVPAQFQPRRPDTFAAGLDVVIVADLRSYALTNSWVASLCRALHKRNLSVGLSHYPGLRVDAVGSDQLPPEIAELFVDGTALPVSFGERRDIGAVVVADAALLQHFPWQPTPWRVQRVLARRIVADVSTDMYDDATASFTSLRLFGSRPGWIGATAEIQPILTWLRSGAGHLAGIAVDESVESFQRPKADYGLWGAADRRFDITLQLRPVPSSSVSAVVRAPANLPFSISHSHADGRWCVVVGWPSFGFEVQETASTASELLLAAWSTSADEFEKLYADLGGNCVVIRGNRGVLAIRSTSTSVAVNRVDGTVRLSSSEVLSDGLLLHGGNSMELVVGEGVDGHFNPLATPVTHDGSPIDELQQMIGWELQQSAGPRPAVILDDDIQSAFALGLLRASIERVDVGVRRATSRVAKFLEARAIDFRIVNARRGAEQGGDTARCLPSGVTEIAKSYRFRRLLDIVQWESMSGPELDGMWLGLGNIPDDGAQPGRGYQRSQSDAESSKVLLPRRSSGSTSNDLPTGEEESLSVRIAPDLARNEAHPLLARVRRGSTDRLVVVLSPTRCAEGELSFTGSGISVSELPDSLMILADTSIAHDPHVGYGWFFGSVSDNLVFRYVQLVRQAASKLGCTDIVVAGEGRAALPAVLLASFFEHATALITDPESVAGEADEADFDQFIESVSGGTSREAFTAAHADRLQLRNILSAASSGLRVVIASGGNDIRFGSTEAASYPRSGVVDVTASAWLTASVDYSANQYQ